MNLELLALSLTRSIQSREAARAALEKEQAAHPSELTLVKLEMTDDVLRELKGLQAEVRACQSGQDNLNH